MDKRYQVFISSTFTDLKDERQAALRAVLELDHMPAGMELFPAADDSAWQLISDVIDASDYYVVIVGGRYGSLDEEGLGYTEKEYDYALASKKPVISLLHERPDNLPRERTDTGASWEKLQEFRAKIEKRHTCVYWTTAEELKARLIVGLTSAVKRHPQTGWVRADQVPAKATLTDVLALRERVADLERQLEAERTGPPPGIEELMQGDDAFEVSLEFTARTALDAYPYHQDQGYTATVEPSWNEIFAAVAPAMINEATDETLRTTFMTFFTRYATEQFGDDGDLKGKELRKFRFEAPEIETCFIQLRALGLIQESQRKRSVHDKSTYWTLTPFGDRRMVQLRALHKTRPKTKKTGAKEAREADPNDDTKPTEPKK